MVKRLLGFVLLIGVVALLLQWVSDRQSQPEPEPEPTEVEVAVAPEVATEDAPAPEPEPPNPPIHEETPSTPPSPVASPPTESAAPSSPTDDRTRSESPAAVGEDSVPETTPPAPPAAEPTSDAPSPAAEAAKPTKEPDPPASAEAEPAPPATPAPETPTSEATEPPSAPTPEKPRVAQSAAEDEVPPGASETLPPAADEQAPALSTPVEQERPQVAPERTTRQATPAPAPEAPVPAASERAKFEERVVPDGEFSAVEQAQGRTDERTDAQRRHQEEDGWYGWGVLTDYADPDQAARLLGGAAVVQRNDSFFTLRERAGGEVTARPIGNLSAAYGSIGLRGHGSAFRQRLRRALSTRELRGREDDYTLWYLFPRREATHLGNKVVAVFECQVRESGLSGEAADRFRKESKLRGEVLALRRANGGRLGIYLPRYFQTGEGRVPVAQACRALDEESRRFGS